MSIKAMNFVWTHSKTKANSLLLMLAIADRADDDGICYRSIKNLAEKSRMSYRQAHRLINKLEKSGELIVHRGKGVKTQYGTTHKYQINGMTNCHIVTRLSSDILSDDSYDIMMSDDSLKDPCNINTEDYDTFLYFVDVLKFEIHPKQAACELGDNLDFVRIADNKTLHVSATESIKQRLEKQNAKAIQIALHQSHLSGLSIEVTS